MFAFYGVDNEQNEISSRFQHTASQHVVSCSQMVQHVCNWCYNCVTEGQPFLRAEDISGNEDARVQEVSELVVQVSMISGSNRQIAGLRPDDSFGSLCRKIEHAFDLPVGKAQICSGVQPFGSNAFHNSLASLGITQGTELICIRRVLPETLNRISVGEDQDNRGKWCGAVAVEERIYFVPFNAFSILELDTLTGVVRTIRTNHIHAGTAKWAGAAVLDDVIYFSPCLAPCVLQLEVRTGRVQGISTTGILASGDPKWHGAVACDGHVFFVPHNAPGVLQLEAATGNLSMIPTDSIYQGDQKWSGAAVSDDCIYFAPFYAPCILVLHIPSRSTHQVSTNNVYRGDGKWTGAVAVDGIIFFAPFNAPCVLRLDVSTGVTYGIQTNSHALSFRTFPFFGSTTYEQQWSGVESVNGEVYFVPFNADHVLQLTVGHNSLNTIPLQTECADGGKWHGGVSLNGKLYFAPSDASCILELL